MYYWLSLRDTNQKTSFVLNVFVFGFGNTGLSKMNWKVMCWKNVFVEFGTVLFVSVW